MTGGAVRLHVCCAALAEAQASQWALERAALQRQAEVLLEGESDEGVMCPKHMHSVHVSARM